MPVAPAAADLLSALAGILARWGPWYLFGAQAVVAYGVPRLSADVDVTLKLTPDTPGPFVEEMRAAGFEPRVDDPEFVRKTRVLPFVHVATGMPLLGRARRLVISGVEVPTIDPGDLMVAKILAGRPKDIEDARGLWRARHSEMDAARIASTLRLLEGDRSRRRRAVAPAPGKEVLAALATPAA